MSAWLPRWVRASTEPSEAEVAGVVGELDSALAASAASATEPTPLEVQRLLARAGSAHAATRRGVWMAGAALALAAVVALGVVVSSGGDAALDSASPGPGTAVALRADVPIALAPGVTAAGTAVVLVLAVEPEGVLLTVRDGTARIAADRPVVADAGAVWALSTGGTFVLDASPGAERIQLVEGDVSAWFDGVVSRVEAGAQWRRPVRVAAVEPAPVPVEGALAQKVENAGPSARMAPTLQAERPESVDALARVLALADAERWDDALRAADGWIARHGDDPAAADLVPEASYWRVVALRHTRDPRSALAAATSWLGRHGQHPRRADVLRLGRALALNSLHDCRTALVFLRELHDTAPAGERAGFAAERGLCAYSLDADGEARESLRDALRGGVDGELGVKVRQALSVYE